MTPTLMATTELPAGPTNLPMALTPLIGRGHELQSLVASRGWGPAGSPPWPSQPGPQPVAPGGPGRDGLAPRATTAVRLAPAVRGAIEAARPALHPRSRIGGCDHSYLRARR